MAVSYARLKGRRGPGKEGKDINDPNFFIVKVGRKGPYPGPKPRERKKEGHNQQKRKGRKERGTS